MNNGELMIYHLIFIILLYEVKKIKNKISVVRFTYPNFGAG